MLLVVDEVLNMDMVVESLIIIRLVQPGFGLEIVLFLAYLDRFSGVLLALLLSPASTWTHLRTYILSDYAPSSHLFFFFFCNTHLALL